MSIRGAVRVLSVSALFSVLVVVGVPKGGRDEGTIKARRLLLVGSDGSTRGVLEAQDDRGGPSVALMDADGGTRCELRVDGKESKCVVYGENRATSVELAAEGHRGSVRLRAGALEKGSDVSVSVHPSGVVLFAQDGETRSFSYCGGEFTLEYPGSNERVFILSKGEGEFVVDYAAEDGGGVGVWRDSAGGLIMVLKDSSGSSVRLLLDRSRGPRIEIVKGGKVVVALP